MRLFAARVNSRSRLLACLLAAALPALKGAEATLHPDIQAESHDHDLATGMTILKGAVITYGDAVLRGDEIHYDTNKGVAVARGHVSLAQGKRRVLADEITYYFKDGVYTVIGPKLGAYPVYLTGASASGNRDEVVIQDAHVSYGEPGAWTPSLSAPKITYHRQDDSFSSSGATAGVGAAKFLPLPSISHSVGLSLRSYTTLLGGYKSRLGAFVDAGVRIPVADGLKFGGDIGYYSRRGLLFGPGGSYDLAPSADTFVKGSLRTGYINDVGDRSTDLLGHSVPEQRSFVEWEHHQQLAPGLTLDAEVNQWRDSEVMRDFRRRDFVRDEAPDSYLEGMYAGDNYSVSLLTRYRFNDFHRLQERLPELRFDLLPSPLLLGVYERGEASYVRLREREVGGGAVTMQADRADAYYGLERPFSKADWLSLTAVAGARVTHYADTLPGSDGADRTRYLGELGFDAHLLSSATFDYKNETWGIDGLRHLVKPFVSYRYIPERKDGDGTIPQIDREAFSTYLQPLGLGDARHIDTLHQTNTVRAGVENTLQTRDESGGSRSLASLILAQDYHFRPDPLTGHHSDLNAALSVTPIRWFSFDTYSSFDPKGMRMHELNTGMSIRDGQEWMLRLSTHHLRNDITEYVSYFEKRIDERYSGYVRFHYDQRNSRITEQSYGVIHNVSNAWLFRYEVSLFDGSRREGSFELSIAVDARIF
jgi:LPS-assembly protein